MSDNQPMIRVLGFKTTYERLPKRGTDPLNDTTDEKGFLLDEKGKRVMAVQEEDWVIYSPAHSPLNTKNVERIRHIMPDPDRMGEDPDGSKLGFMQARWAQIEPAYNAWKAGNEVPQSGIPLSAWPGVNAEQVEVFRQLGIRSVEEVRDLTDGQLERVRLPNSRELRTQAKLFIENMSAAAAAEREAARDIEVDGLRARLAEVEVALAAAKAPPADDETAELHAQLDAAGIAYETGWGAPKLRGLLRKAA